VGRTQRNGALRVASTYRTVSREAILAVSGIIPIDMSRGEENRSHTNQESRSRRHWTNGRTDGKLHRKQRKNNGHVV